MKLFQNENIIIKDIKTVAKYLSTDEEIARSPKKSYSYTLPTYELIFFFEGESAVKFGDVTIKDLPNSLRYLPKGAKGGKYEVEAFKKNVCIDIYFDTDSPMPGNAIAIYNISKLKQLFEKIYNIWSEKKSGYYVRSMNILYEIIYIIKKHEALYTSPLQNEKMLTAYEYIAQNFRNADFDYEKLSLAAGVSYSYFKNLFIAYYGMSPNKFVTQMRIDYAKELLMTGRYAIGRIAEMCGYENVYYFSNVFKKNVGVSPKKYMNT